MRYKNAIARLGATGKYSYQCGSENGAHIFATLCRPGATGKYSYQCGSETGAHIYATLCPLISRSDFLVSRDF